MNKQKILIADNSEEFSLNLAEVLHDAYQICISREGVHTLELLQTFCPDILVLDLTLPGMDGITLLQTAAKNGYTPMVLATTRFTNPYVMDSLAKLGVGYVIAKPCNIKAVAARLADLSNHLGTSMLMRTDPKTTVSDIMQMLGVPTKLRGYCYIREAVPLMAKDPMQSITKELYPAVAARKAGTASQVERSIRSAINAAWKNRDEQVWQRYFKPGADGQIPRPTNAAFISRLADWISNDDCFVGIG